jgi:hypothetical protein
MGTMKGRKRSREALKSLSESFTVAGEAKTLLGKVAKVLAAAEKSGSHALTLSGVREAKGLLDLLGRTTGELAPQGQTTINLALGVTVDAAKLAVETVESASALLPAEVADRAEACLRMYNLEHPEDMRIVEAVKRIGTGSEGDGAVPPLD